MRFTAQIISYLPASALHRGGVVGDPGIEPGVGLPGGVTVRCRTLQLVARREAGNSRAAQGGQPGKRRISAAFVALPKEVLTT